MTDIAEVRADLERLKSWCRAQDPNATIWLHINQAADLLTAQQARIEGMIALIDKHARHDGLCGIVGGYGYCTCGLDAARLSLSAEAG